MLVATAAHYSRQDKARLIGNGNNKARQDSVGIRRKAGCCGDNAGGLGKGPKRKAAGSI